MYKDDIEKCAACVQALEATELLHTHTHKLRQSRELFLNKLLSLGNQTGAQVEQIEQILRITFLEANDFHSNFFETFRIFELLPNSELRWRKPRQSEKFKKF